MLRQIPRRPRMRRQRVFRASRNSLLSDNIVPALQSYIQPVDKIYRSRLSYLFTLSTSSGGNILAAEPVNPTSASDFLSLGALYDEYRVMGGTLNIIYTNQLVSSSSSQEPSLMFVAYDFNDVAAPGSVTDVLSYGNRTQFRAISLDRVPFVYQFKYPIRGAATSIPWTPTASPVSYGSLKFAGTGMTPSSLYFEAVLDIYVQFRGRV